MGNLLLRGGRVIDPGSQTDEVQEVLVADGRISEVGPIVAAPEGTEILDVSGLVVGPGFIDLHQHAQDSAAYLVMVRDGTTTAL